MPMRFGIITISDRSARGERPDASGPVLQLAVESQGWQVSKVETIPDEFAVIRDTLTYADRHREGCSRVSGSHALCQS